MSPSRTVIFDASNCAYRRDGAKQGPDAAWLYAVVDAVLATLRPGRWSLVFDAHMFGRLRRGASGAHATRLREDKAAGRVTTCAADTKADAFILNAARSAGAVVVSNDLFRDHGPLRVGIPMLRVEAIFGAPSLDGYLLVYPTVDASTPDRRLLPSAAPAAPTPKPAPAPVASTPMAQIRAAMDAVEANDLALSQAVHALREALGKAEADALVAERVGRKQGMWRALFVQGVPGWRLEGERVFRVPAPHASQAQAPRAPTTDLEALRGHLGALVDAGVIDASRLNCQARAHWREALEGLVTEAVGGRRSGRWIRFLQTKVPALKVARRGPRWQAIRADQAGQPVRHAVCIAVRAAAASLTGPVTQRDFVRRLQASIPAHLAQAPTGFDSVAALLKAFPDVIRLELAPNGQLWVHPMPGAHPPPRPTVPSAANSVPPVDELAARRARGGVRR